MTFYTLFFLVFTIGIIMEFTSVSFLLTVISIAICASNPSQGRYRYIKSVKFLNIYVDATNSYTFTFLTLFV